MASVTFLTQTLGCRVNQAETKQIADKLVSWGYQPCQKQQSPQVIILNTCVITQKGERESVKTIRQAKKQYPDSFLIVTGCAVNLWLNITKKELLPPADLFINNEEKAKIAKIITNRFPLDPDITKPKSLQVPGSVKRSFIKIQDGCNHFCSYCIVPHLRTKPTSKNSEQIVREINQAHRAGIREAILCGINLSSYGHDLDPPVSFSYLIKEILEKTTIPRLSLSSLTPKLINQELINIFIADQKKDQRLSSYWHLALQSGSESVLGRMKRQTDLKQLTRSLQYIKEALPHFTLRADIIIGFPGETDQEFNQTLGFIKNNGFTFGHLFPYSPRPKTLAQEMLKRGVWQIVSDQTKKFRREKLIFALGKNRQTEAKNLVGNQRPVLILKSTSYGWWGLSDNYWPTKIKVKKNTTGELVGKIIPVKITDFEDKTLRGNLIRTN